MELCIDVMLYSNLGNVWAISNVHVGRIWPTGCRFPTPDL